ncbi:type IV toxin-antitoxin system AbiEi family antitoxin domain-containing protein [Puerhibacterium sp. TATVAM-FAB25]|uniref:type IV toxin-antitoxin system AbiEi family antitoxin domain-containing protein n=1 Tax=Puerhibacterium sp. TATVAM-FAB25 TaxID=3093699 RepID=UPI003979FC0B
MPRRPPPVPRRLLALAAVQAGLVSARQCAAAGVTSQHVAEAVRRGAWSRPARGVYDVGGVDAREGADPLDHARRRAAVLGVLAHPGSVATGLSALVLHGVQGAPRAVAPEVTFPDGSARRTRPPVRLRRVPLRTWTLVGDLPCATVADALAQAVPEVDRRHAVAVLDSALRTGRLTDAGLAGLREAVRGRRGAARVHRWWDQADRRSESPAETWARLACADAGFPPDVLQLPVLDGGGRFLARVDLAWLLPDGRALLVEIDGRDPHSQPAALFADRARQNRIVTAGTVLRRYTGAEAWRGTLAADVGVVLRAAGWRAGQPCPARLVLR